MIYLSFVICYDKFLVGGVRTILFCSAIMEKKNNFLSKKEILDAAETAFRRFGPKKTSVTDIAKALNVSHGTIYRHYPSKTVLREAVTERWLEEKIVAPLNRLLIHFDALSADVLLKSYLLKLISLKQIHAESDPEMFEMYAEVTAETAELINKHVKSMIQQMNLIIEKGIKTKIFTNIEDLNDFSQAVFHATSRFHHPSHAYEWKYEAIEDEFENVWMLITKGFLVNKTKDNKGDIEDGQQFKR